MTADRRKKNVNWYVADEDGAMYGNAAECAILMDIRDELQTLNRLLNCPNFLEVPGVLRSIARNTVRPRKKRKREGHVRK